MSDVIDKEIAALTQRIRAAENDYRPRPAARPWPSRTPNVCDGGSPTTSVG